ncbi:MAG: hypothetical protein ABIL25_01995 [candidate division WOR-3 bacterium]
MREKHGRVATVIAVLTVVVLSAPLFAAPANNKPCLCQPTIKPMDGVARTTYVATVRYSDPDGDAASVVNVCVDDVAYPMRLVKGRPDNGTYQARLTLPPGEHSYYFYAEDARGMSERFPRYGAKSGPFVGSRKPYNRLPMLSEGGVYFDWGSDRDIYTFTVRYQDKDCPKPPTVRVVVDGIVHDMKLHNGTPNDGIYLYQAVLPAGPHAYYFVARDGNGDCITHPRYGFLRGPEVQKLPNSPPELRYPKVIPPAGSHLTRYSYTVEYEDKDFDPPAVALIYIDDIPHPMRLAATKPYYGIYVFRTNLHISPYHNYYFYFEDGKGGTCRLPARGKFHGPVVTR